MKNFYLIFSLSILISACKKEEVQPVIPVEVNGQWGYFTKEKMIVKPQFRNARPFFKGVAVVQNNKRKVGLIDKTGKQLLPITYGRSDIMYTRKSDFITVRDSLGRFFFVDFKGKVQIPVEALAGKYDKVYTFQDGLCLVEKDGKVGYINTAAEEVIQCKYYRAGNFSNGYAVASTGRDDYYGVIDKTGKNIIPFYNDESTGGNSFHEGYILVVREFRSKPKAERYSKIFYNTEGESALDASRYDVVSSFHNGLAYIAKDRKYGFIDKEGNEYFNPHNNFTKVGRCSDLFTDDHFSHEFYNERLIAVEKDKKLWGYVDRNGTEAIPFRFEKAHGFREGLAAVKDGKYWGFINTKGSLEIPLRYKDVSDFTNGIAAVKGDKGWLFIDKTGFEYTQENLQKTGALAFENIKEPFEKYLEQEVSFPSYDQGREPERVKLKYSRKYAPKKSELNGKTFYSDLFDNTFKVHDEKLFLYREFGEESQNEEFELIMEEGRLYKTNGKIWGTFVDLKIFGKSLVILSGDEKGTVCSLKN